MSEAWVMAENERRMMSMVRMGTVTALDAPNGRIRADVGGVGTDWLPWITGRAGSTKHWSAPSIGEQVLVLAPFGDTLQAVVLAGVFSDGNPQPSASADVEKTVYRDGTSVTYDAASHALTIDCVGTVTINCTNATVKAQAVTIDAPSTTCTGDLLIKGKTTAQGLLTYQAGMAGSGAGEGAGATISGNVSLSGGSITHNGVNIGASHTHGGVQGGGGSTGAAQ